MTHAIVPTQSISQIGQVANAYASRQAFNDYQTRKSSNTLRAQRSDLATFAGYLCEAGITECPTGDDLQNDPDAWQGVTWGLVSGFVQWMQPKGFAVASINRKLMSVKVYAGLAAKAGILDPHENTLIHAVATFAHKEVNRVNEKRTVTRQSTKKEINVSITPAQAKELKLQPSGPQGRRDAVIMCLLLDHGLRVGELARLTVNNINMARGELVFFRDKVQKTQRHAMTPDTKRALASWFNTGDVPAMGSLLRKSIKGGALGGAGMGEHSINIRVGELGERIGKENLGPHDCRHFWATNAIQRGTDPFALMQAGGWTSMQTVQKYVDENVVANAGVKVE